MNIMATSKNKIVEVLAYAREVSIRHGHTRKYAKHLVALAIKQMMQLTDRELAVFLSENDIGKILNYKQHFNFTIFSKVRKESAQIIRELFELFAYQKTKAKQARLFAIDSTDIPAFSLKDKDARCGHRTPPKKEQNLIKNKEKTLFYGYKLHVIVDADTELPIAVTVATANRHDKKFFHLLYNKVKQLFGINPFNNVKLLADAAYDATDIYQELHYDNVKPVIAINGRGFYKSSIPKDPEYGRRWAVERVFSRLKEVFGLAKNKFIGIGKVMVHAYACLIAYLIKYL